MRSQLRLLLVVIIAYLIGSIPFGYLIVRAKGGGDVRDTGSGGTGATNVSRRAGKALGVVTLILDALKGAIAVIIAQLMLKGDDPTWLPAAAAIAVIVGHVFPVWLRFRGGKGVATGVGVFLMLAPLAVLCCRRDIRRDCCADKIRFAWIDPRGSDDPIVRVVVCPGSRFETGAGGVDYGCVVDCVRASRKHRAIIERY